jgi:PmbA protein
MCVSGTDLSIDVRNDAVENSGFSEAKTIGIRALIDQQAAIVSGSDFSTKGLKEMIARVISNAKIVPPDPNVMITSQQELYKNYQPIQDICDNETPDISVLIDKAKSAERKALSFEGITNSEGAGCSFGRYHVFLATSNGFSGHYEKTISGLSCSVIGGTGVDMQRDYDYTTSCLFDNLKSPEEIGETAALRTIKKLHPKQMKSGSFPVIFDKRVGRSLLSYFSGAISADKISRGLSFIGNKIGEQIFSKEITIIDNPHLKGGLASVPFDGEGVYNPELVVVENGVLKELFVHGLSARKLGIKNNGRASRSPGGNATPGSTNLYIKAGNIKPEALYKDVSYGFYVTETIGHGLNDVTGDYSIGAAGFLIENGILTHPINEVTLAGNLIDVFKSMTVADDLIFESRKNVPTIRVDSLTIAGT